MVNTRLNSIKNVIKNYIWSNPSLIFAGRNYYEVLNGNFNYSNYYFSKKLEEITGDNLISSLDFFLSQQFRDHLNKYKFKEVDGRCLLLFCLVRMIKPEIVIETGVGAGASTSFMLCAMNENKRGKLYSIDLPPPDHNSDNTNENYIILEDGAKYQSKPPVGYLIPDYLKNRWQLIYGDSKEELPNLLKRLGECSIFYHDSLHTNEHMKMEYEIAWPFIKKGGYLVSHDVLWTSAFSDFSKKVGEKCTIYNTLGILKKS